MESKNMKLDITSSAVEKSVDVASSFLSKLITPAAEEVGLLIKDKITYWRFAQQVRVLNKAKEYCSKHNISPKAISPKLLVPLIEHASLEDDEFLLDRWAIMLSNMVDSEQNIKNNVFPFILSQISKEEYIGLETDLKRRDSNLKQIAEEIVSENINHTIESHKKISRLRDQASVERFLSERSNLSEIEISNLVRCGLLKVIAIQSGYSRGVDVNIEGAYTKDFEIEVEHVEDRFIFTELGERFIEVCSEKIKKNI